MEKRHELQVTTNVKLLCWLELELNCRRVSVIQLCLFGMPLVHIQDYFYDEKQEIKLLWPYCLLSKIHFVAVNLQYFRNNSQSYAFPHWHSQQDSAEKN